MNASILTTAAALSDRQLMSRLQLLAANERSALVELLAHLAELDTRRSLYAAEGFGSLWAYCTRALHLSEDAAYYRIEAARTCRRFPVILDLLADGSLTLTAVRTLGRHLTPENHVEVLAAARRRTKPEIEALVARLAPKPDAKPVIRRIADPKPSPGAPARARPDAPIPSPTDDPAVTSAGPVNGATINTATNPKSTATGAPGPAEPEVLSQPAPARRPVIRTSAPSRFLVQLTVGQETHDRFRRLQALCARKCQGGDPVAVFDLVCLVAENEMLRRKRAAAATRGRGSESRTGPQPGPQPVARAVARPGARPGARSAAQAEPQPASANGRHVAAAVSRAVWARDGERCAFVGPAGRCTGTKFLELHHRIPWALGGPTTTDNLSVRCRLHNAYEAEQVFGPRAVGRSRNAIPQSARAVRSPRVDDSPPGA